MNLNSDTLFSAVKRKNVRDILLYVFNEAGEEAAFNVLNDKTRLTDAAITEIRQALGTTIPSDVDAPDTTTPNYEVSATATVDKGDEAEIDATTKDATDLTYADGDVIDMTGMLTDLEKAIGKGKKKKAKKLVAELEDLGLKGSVFKDLKKQVKAL